MADRICTAPDCGEPGQVPGSAKGMCLIHYNEWRRTSAAHACRIEGCDRLAGVPGTAQGYCAAHYSRWKAHGDPLAGRLPNGTQLAQRIARWTEADPVTGCLVWTGTRDWAGYGRLLVRNKGVRAHRAAWEAAGRELDPELELDHLCSNRSCVNVDHLEQVTHAENMRRSGVRRTT